MAGGVELAVRLGARTPHRRALAAIQHPELDAALVGDPAHQAVQRIDLADQMALAEPADRRIAGHRADGRKPVGDQRGLRAHARSRSRGLTAGVAAADHDDVERIHDEMLYLSGRFSTSFLRRGSRNGSDQSRSACFT